MRELETHRKQIGDIVQYHHSGLDMLEFHSGAAETRLIKERIGQHPSRFKTRLTRAQQPAEAPNLGDEAIAKVEFSRWFRFH